MRPIKIVVIGAGSASFGLNTLATLLREPEIRGSTLALVDINSQALERMCQIASRMNAAWNAGATIQSSTDRTALLPDADFVVCSVEKGNRGELWRQDYRIPLEHGVRQPYAENGGPAGFAHFARQVPPIMDIARDMERLCPRAWLLNFSNPVPRITRAVSKYTRIKVVGLCHQINYAYRLAGRLLADILDIRNDSHVRYPSGSEDWLSKMPGWIAYNAEVLHKLDIKAAGLNHFTWILEMRNRRDGTDLYPEFKRRFAAQNDDPLMRDMMQFTGLCPVPGDHHLAEYLPFCHNPASKPWDRYGLNPPAFCLEADTGTSARDLPGRLTVLVCNFADGTMPIEPLRAQLSEGVWEIVRGITTNDNAYHVAVNVPNRGSLPDLPFDSIVEVPAVTSGYGINGLIIGHLPSAVAELLRRETAVVEFAVDAAVTGDRHTALQALMMDPVIDDYETAKSVLKDYLDVQAAFLPQFHGQWAW